MKDFEFLAVMDDVTAFSLTSDDLISAFLHNRMLSPRKGLIYDCWLLNFFKRVVSLLDRGFHRWRKSFGGSFKRWRRSRFSSLTRMCQVSEGHRQCVMETWSQRLDICFCYCVFGDGACWLPTFKESLIFCKNFLRGETLNCFYVIAVCLRTFSAETLTSLEFSF